MSHERYPIEERTHVAFSNPEWHKFAGKEYRYPSDKGEALVVEEGNCTSEEVEQLKERGAIFPLEIAQPVPATFKREREPHI